MSGSGGFYKYRCKYFYTHNCPNWVWVNNSPCQMCCAEGRDAEATMAATSTTTSTATGPSPAPYSYWRVPRDVLFPTAHNGTLQYTLMEMVLETGQSGPYWTIRQKPPVHQQAQFVPAPAPAPAASPAHAGDGSGAVNPNPEWYYH